MKQVAAAAVVEESDILSVASGLHSCPGEPGNGGRSSDVGHLLAWCSGPRLDRRVQAVTRDALTPVLRIKYWRETHVYVHGMMRRLFIYIIPMFTLTVTLAHDWPKPVSPSRITTRTRSMYFILSAVVLHAMSCSDD